MKVISFSLWGKSEKYLVGAMENICLAKEIYPDWQCWFYLDSSVPSYMHSKINESGGRVILISDVKGLYHGMFWRFLSIDDPEVDVFISRDCDSRLNYREKAAVDEWLASNKCLHTMHDHPYHKPVPILRGMWGLKKGCVNNMREKIDKWGFYHKKGIDQEFLHRVIWPLLVHNCIRHDSQGFSRWGPFKPFPVHKPLKFSGKYVGEIFNENNKMVGPAK